MNELKPEDVMRALECCVRRECMPCPNKERRTGITECMECLMQDALALLREKNAEIERLKTEVNLYENTCGKLIVRDNGEVVGFIDGQEKTYISKDIARVLRSMAVTTARDKAIDEIKVRFSMHFGTYTDKDMTQIKELFGLIDRIAEEMREVEQ